MNIEIAPASGPELAGPLRLLAEFLRDGEPVPESFVERLQDAVQTGALEVLAARTGGETVGVATLAYRLNASVGSLFASVEDLYVRPDAGRRGVGRALLKAVDERCAARGISYVEVQVEDAGAEAFYSALGYKEEPGVRILFRSYPLADRSQNSSTW